MIELLRAVFAGILFFCVGLIFLSYIQEFGWWYVWSGVIILIVLGVGLLFAKR